MRSCANRSFLRSRAALLVLIAGSFASLAGCESGGSSSEPRAGSGVLGLMGGRTSNQPWSGPVVMDGDISEWPRETVAFADDQYFYLRFSVEGEPRALQASDQTVTIHLDIDGNGGTGATLLDPIDAAGMGVDLEIAFSPRKPDGTLASGAAAAIVDASGTRTRIPTAALDLLFTPTYASGWYEVRISRHVATGTDTSTFEEAGPWEGVITLADKDGQIRGWSDAFLATKPAAADQPALSDVVLPGKPEGSIRVLNWNVLWNSPEKNPASFVRVIESVRPDVVLIQEWVADEPAQIARWFTERIDSPTGSWHALHGKSRGIAIVAPHPITPLIKDGVEFPHNGRDHGARFVAGIVPLPIGDIVVGSTHLKCCGSAGSPEDVTRIAEARAIATTLGAAMASDPTWVRVIGGDMNLVGTRAPLDEIGRGLDVDGSGLAAAPVRVLGDRSTYTWVDWNTQFTPGRLDWVLYSDAGSEVLNAFAIDTRRLSDAALARMGLDRMDSAGSDHLPIVVDVRIRK
ncbi:MAG: endonuclease/exonuclease/phosphatase family protein [Phycisphaeraceae bacterium]|nr:MAG: endonuclease/exonuclease/phosphatase family protein [Phycisphaeraceae bacterium]